MCNPTTGVCSNPNQADGSPCNDGNRCTQTDTCTAGVCGGANPIVCVAPDACHDPGTCNPETGACSEVTKTDGTRCDDGNACTRADACHLGQCIGGDPVVCNAPDECHAAGACRPANGTCETPALPDGTRCTGGTCAAGVCVPLVDAASDTPPANDAAAPQEASIPDVTADAGPAGDAGPVDVVAPDAPLDASTVETGADAVARPDAVTTADAPTANDASDAVAIVTDADSAAVLDAPETALPGATTDARDERSVRGGSDATPDAASNPVVSSEGGCGCRVATRDRSPSSLVWMALLTYGLVRRRRSLRESHRRLLEVRRRDDAALGRRHRLLENALFDALHQKVDVERLFHEIVGAGAKRLEPIVVLRTRGVDDHRDRLRSRRCFEMLEHVRAVHVGKSEIEKDQIWLSFARESNSELAGPRVKDVDSDLGRRSLDRSKQ
jgi:MYXO-CTERM domain-containing protein